MTLLKRNKVRGGKHSITMTSIYHRTGSLTLLAIVVTCYSYLGNHELEIELRFFDLCYES